jgi:hypothetical protein
LGDCHCVTDAFSGKPHHQWQSIKAFALKAILQ